jgi:hypothetical protein
MRLAVAALGLGIGSVLAVNSIDQVQAGNSTTKALYYIGTFVVGLVVGSKEAEAEQAKLAKEAEERERQRQISDIVKRALASQQAPAAASSTHQPSPAVLAPNTVKLDDNPDWSKLFAQHRLHRFTPDGPVAGQGSLGSPTQPSTAVLAPNIVKPDDNPDWSKLFAQHRLHRFTPDGPVAGQGSLGSPTQPSTAVLAPNAVKPDDNPDWSKLFAQNRLHRFTPDSPVSGQGSLGSPTQPSPAPSDVYKQLEDDPNLWIRHTQWQIRRDSHFKPSSPLSSSPSTPSTVPIPFKLYKLGPEYKRVTTAGHCVSYIDEFSQPCDWNGSVCRTRDEKLIHTGTGEQIY